MRKHPGVSLMVGDIKMIFRTFDAVVAEGDVTARKEHTLEFAINIDEVSAIVNRRHFSQSLRSDTVKFTKHPLHFYSQYHLFI